MQITPAIAAVLLGITLSCSSVPVYAQGSDESEAVNEPGEQEIEDAYAAHIADINRRSSVVFENEDAASMQLTLENLTKLGCQEIEREGVHYDCRVERRMRQADHRPKTDVVQLWLSYEDARWVAR
jgi:hypothetical protein